MTFRDKRIVIPGKKIWGIDTLVENASHWLDTRLVEAAHGR
jgi:hypothetical protein